MCGNFHENTVGEKVEFHCQAGNNAAAKTLREQGIIKVVNKKIKIMSSMNRKGRLSKCAYYVHNYLSMT